MIVTMLACPFEPVVVNVSVTYEGAEVTVDPTLFVVVIYCVDLNVVLHIPHKLT